jgi:C_GCAxxG_C_C family probable redox protein
MDTLAARERCDRALHLFANGRNCAQAVLLAFGPETGLPQTTLSRLSSGLGGGMGGMGHTCGAINGGALAISAILGGESPDEKDKNKLARDLVGQFILRCEDRFGELTCSGLIGTNVRNEMAREEARAVGAYRQTCNDVVAGVVELVAEMTQAQGVLK